MENSANWRAKSPAVYSISFELRLVDRAFQHGVNVAKLTRENGVDLKLI